MIGRVACVTGAGGGIGREVTLLLAARGWTVVAADVDPAAAAACADAGEDRVHAATCDVADECSVAELAATVWRVAGRLDVLVANAAVYPRLLLADTTTTDAARVLGVNLEGAIASALAMRPLIADSGGGAMVFVTSGSGDVATARHRLQRGFSLYGASKAALDRWVVGVCDELAHDGIAANLICPGAVVRTGGVRAVPADSEIAGREIAVERVAEAIVALCGADVREGPVGRRFLATGYGREWGSSVG